jgi:hypothetical protein
VLRTLASPASSEADHYRDIVSSVQGLISGVQRPILSSEIFFQYPVDRFLSTDYCLDMQKRSSIKVAIQRPDDSRSTKNPAAVALGRLGGLKGGKARAAKLSPKQRSQIAKKAAAVRWSAEPEE